MPAIAAAGPCAPVEILRDCDLSGSTSLSEACGEGADGGDFASASLVISM